MKFSLDQFRQSLRQDRHNTHAPDGIEDFSEIVQPLMRITRDGRALHSNDEFGFADFMSNLLDEFLGESPDEESRDRCIAGMSVFVSIILQQIAIIAPDWRPEEMLLDCTGQSDIRRIIDLLRTVPVSREGSQLVPDFAQLPFFHNAIPLDDFALEGFIKRRIAPAFMNDDGSRFTQDDQNELTKSFSSSEWVNITDLGELETDALDGFDEYYDEFFGNENKYLPNTGDDSDDD